jgi:hypothetical protein
MRRRARPHPLYTPALHTSPTTPQYARALAHVLCCRDGRYCCADNGTLMRLLLLDAVPRSAMDVFTPPLPRFTPLLTSPRAVDFSLTVGTFRFSLLTVLVLNSLTNNNDELHPSTPTDDSWRGGHLCCTLDLMCAYQMLPQMAMTRMPAVCCYF